MRANTGAIDKALAERERQMRNYKTQKRAKFLELCADPEHGEWLRKFVATLNHFGIDDAVRMMEYVTVENRKWLSTASDDIRHAALEAIGNRIMRIREKYMMPALDDPLPEQDDDVFRVCKRVLGL